MNWINLPAFVEKIAKNYVTSAKNKLMIESISVIKNEIQMVQSRNSLVVVLKWFFEEEVSSSGTRNYAIKSKNQQIYNMTYNIPKGNDLILPYLTCIMRRYNEETTRNSNGLNSSLLNLTPFDLMASITT